MADDRKMLVVDDEEVVCLACRRIFARQGFEIEVNTDARQGLAWATDKDYSIILLDIKMPNIDGIEFLEKLREKKPDVPVLIITGYPSIPNASAAMRLGACDYVTKPFTSEEITWAVQRVLSTSGMLSGDGEQAGAGRGRGRIRRAGRRTLFWDESWVKLEVDGSACVGAVLPGLRGSSQATAVRLPRIGEVLYQGLPLAGVTVSDKPAMVVPSPVSGVVIAVNQALVHAPVCWPPIRTAKDGSPTSVPRGTRKWKTASAAACCWSTPTVPPPPSRRKNSRRSVARWIASPAATRFRPG